MMRFLWSTGHFVRRNVLLVRYEFGKKTPQQYTDIDVLGIKFDVDLNPYITICDCKSGRASTPNRIFWLSGVMKYFGANRGFFVRPEIMGSKYIEFANKLEILPLSINQISDLEESHKVDAKHYFGSFSSDNIKSEKGIFKKLRALESQVYDYIHIGYWADPVSQQIVSLMSYASKVNKSTQIKEKENVASIGGGISFSALDKLTGYFELSHPNMFGKGQRLYTKFELGGRLTNFQIGFTEPWLFDTPLSAGFDVYNTSMDYDTYDKDSVGGTIRFGYPVLDFTRLYLSYNYDVADIKNLTHDASSAIRDMEGENVANTLTGILRRDSRDRVFGTTVGSDNSITIKHAGTPFGGDIGYTKYVGDSGWYFPLFWNTVGMLHGRIGFINGDSVGKVPQWERFYLGGMGSVRGYEWHDISPRDPVTGDEIGGNKMLQFNVEFVFPIMPESGLQGVLFYDTGNAYDNGENLDIGQLRKSAGGGVRWNSPMGPISLEYGYILDDLQGKKGEGRWEFSMGSVF